VSIFDELDGFLLEPIVGVEIIDHSYLEAGSIAKVDKVLCDHDFLHLFCLEFMVCLHPQYPGKLMLVFGSDGYFVCLIFDAFAVLMGTDYRFVYPRVYNVKC
jgi:hypothetical protein